MSSMDLDDLDAPTNKPRPTMNKPSRFLKSSNLKPPVRKSEPQDIKSQTLAFSKSKEEVQEQEELDDVKPKPVSSSGINGGNATGSTEMEVDDDETTAEDAMNVDDVEEEDYVVREIDVFCNPSIGDNAQIYVMQYPLRPRWRPYEFEERCPEVRVKPKSIELEIEIDLSIDTKSKNFDSDWVPKSKGAHYDAEWAKNVRLDKQTLSSSWEPPNTSYAIGILTKNKLNLNPIHSVLQFRPSLKHLQYAESVSKKDVKSDVMVKSEELYGRESSRPLNQTKLKRVVNTADKECWIPLVYHNSKSEYSAKYMEKLTTEESGSILFPMTRDDYINSLCPGTSDNISDRGSSKRLLLTLPLEERLEKSISEGDSQVHRFNSLKHLAPDVPDKDLLELIRKYSVLLQGLWITKSDLVFQKDEGAKKMVRDYILYLFSNSQTVSYSQINKLKAAIKERKIGNSKTNFMEVVDRLLNTFAVDRKNLKDWKFKEPIDESFIKFHPDIVADYERSWDLTGNKINKLVFGIEVSSNDARKSTEPGLSGKRGTSVSSDKGAPKTASGNCGGRKVMSDETREAFAKALEVLFKKDPVCSLETIREGLTDLAVSTSMVPKADSRIFLVAAKAVEAPIEELKAVISELAVDVHGVYVSRSSFEHPEYNQLRQVVIDLLCARGPNAKLKKLDISEAAEIRLRREITPTEYTKVLNEICESSRSGWVLKSGHGQLK